MVNNAINVNATRTINSGGMMNGRGRKLTVVVLGSVNVDHVYTVRAVANPAEDVSAPAVGYRRCLGGKGLNQCMALWQACRPSTWIDVRMYGQMAEDADGSLVRRQLHRRAPELLRHLCVLPLPKLPDDDSESMGTGHVVIQHPEDGSHPVSFLWRGCNAHLPRTLIDEALAAADVLVVQNETNDLPYILQTIQQHNANLPAKQRKRLLFNPAPVIPPDLPVHCYHGLDWLVVNRSELQQLLERCQLAFTDDDYHASLCQLLRHLKVRMIVLTVGDKGCLAVYGHNDNDDGAMVHVVEVPAWAPESRVRDPVGAGDCFLGYFLGHVLSSTSDDDVDHDSPRMDMVRSALTVATAAASLAVERLGAFDGIPTVSEVGDRLLKKKPEQHD
jgi:sugar/nucleoside kinase (ribokinase family)